MAHCGYEPTAVNDAVGRPWKAFWTALGKIRTEGDMVADISLEHQRAAENVFEQVVTEAAADGSRKDGATSVYKSKAVA
jgi:hypothetical protein